MRADCALKVASAFRPDRHFRAARLGEMKPPPTRKIKDRPRDLTACRGDAGQGRLKVIGLQDHQRRGQRRCRDAAADAAIGDFLIIRAVVVEAPAKGRSKELLGRAKIGELNSR